MKIGFATLALLFGMLMLYGVNQLAIYFQVYLSGSIFAYLLGVLLLLSTDTYIYLSHDKNNKANYFLFTSSRRTVGVLFLAGLYAIFVPL